MSAEIFYGKCIPKIKSVFLILEVITYTGLRNFFPCESEKHFKKNVRDQGNTNIFSRRT